MSGLLARVSAWRSALGSASLQLTVTPPPVLPGAPAGSPAGDAAPPPPPTPAAQPPTAPAADNDRDEAPLLASEPSVDVAAATEQHRLASGASMDVRALVIGEPP